MTIVSFSFLSIVIFIFSESADALTNKVKKVLRNIFSSATFVIKVPYQQFYSFQT
jgi:hypothetical protein